MPSETLNTGFRRHLFTVELSPSGGGGFSEHSEVLDLKRTVVDEDGNESTDTFDPSYRNSCIDLEMSHPELFS